MPDSPWLRTRVKFYKTTQGYGFVLTPQGDAFFHVKDLQAAGIAILASDAVVEVKLQIVAKGLQVAAIRIPQESPNEKMDPRPTQHGNGKVLDLVERPATDHP